MSYLFQNHPISCLQSGGRFLGLIVLALAVVLNALLGYKCIQAYKLVSPRWTSSSLGISREVQTSADRDVTLKSSKVKEHVQQIMKPDKLAQTKLETTMEENEVKPIQGQGYGSPLPVIPGVYVQQDLKMEQGLSSGLEASPKLIELLKKLPAPFSSADEALCQKIWALDVYWKTAPDQHKLYCITDAGVKTKIADRDTCCKKAGHFVTSPADLVNDGAGNGVLRDLDIGNSCQLLVPGSLGATAQIPASIYSIVKNIQVYTMLSKIPSFDAVAGSLGDTAGCLAHLAWVAANCNPSSGSSPSKGCWEDKATEALKTAWGEFKADDQWDVRNMEALAETEPLKTFCRAWQAADCKGDKSCINGLKADGDKISDVLKGDIDLSSLRR
eukprot:gnl/MRDRNA2_/MRDRNA2_138886_c0_seq1.p1 gnl/MRDRNA2_/MRDRNA2_138886_c0~~gnl/MRDRNA2_/MRDRNA2_138886_c0_seq1.p1  ORF type:complete len:386 (-),score=69.73 gnl/MRDRNA2_/MRDRNA2_138886_c0_seq1:122-1279(-)